MTQTVPAISERFWNKVTIGDGCWSWIGALDGKGYGQFRIDGKNVAAHRLSWLLEHGELDEALCVLHHCDNPPCVRPDHLFVGTMADNSRDMVEKGRWRNGFRSSLDPADVCYKGHKKTSVDGRLICRICTRRSKSAYKRRQIANRPPRACVQCGSYFPAVGRRRYCNKQCKWRAASQKRSGRG